jgi:hypothetical protein
MGALAKRTRWTLSYLRGPLTRDELKRASALSPATDGRIEGRTGEPSGGLLAHAAKSGVRPVLPPGIREVFLPTAVAAPHYVPKVVGVAKVQLTDPKRGLQFVREVRFLAPIQSGIVAVEWESAAWAGASLRDWAERPLAGATFGQLPAVAADPASYKEWSKTLVAWLVRTQGVTRLTAKEFDLVSNPGESEADFRGRLALVARELRDEKVDALRKKWSPKLESLRDRIAKAEAKLAESRAQVASLRVDSAVSVGASLFNALLGRPTATKLVRSAAAASKRTARTRAQSASLAAKEDTVEDLKERLAEFTEELQDELRQLDTRLDPTQMALETVVTRAKKSGVQVDLVALAWDPVA